MFSKSVALRFVCLAFLLSIASASWGTSELFQAPRSYRSDGRYALSIAVADVNGDGKPDLLVADGCCSAGIDNGVVGVLLGNGDGTFQTVQTYYSGGYFADSIAVVDVNGDDKPDLLVANWRTDGYNLTGLVGVLLGNGDGTFQAVQSYNAGGDQATSIAVADVNGDGKPDLIVTLDDSEFSWRLGVLLGNGDGTFQAAQTYHSGGGKPMSVAVADLNSDGRLDLVMANEYSDDSYRHGAVGVLLGNGDGTFVAAQSYHSGGEYADSIAVGDVNGDGKPDLLVANECMTEGCGHGGVVSVLLGNGDGTFQPPQGYRPGGYRTTFIAMGDANGDGKPDLLVANSILGNNRGKVGVLLGNGDGTFQAAQLYESGDGANSLALADVDGDGRLDLLVADQCFDHYCASGGLVSVLLGRFSTITNLNSGLNPSVYGQAVTLTAKVTSTGPLAPTGTVTFKNGSKWLNRMTIIDGVATLTKKNLPAGTLSLTATYNGDPESIKSISTPVSQVVDQASTTTALKSSLNPSAQGQPVTFTAKVTSPTAYVTGTVTFRAGNAILGAVTLKVQKASIMTSTLPPGDNTITATYEGTPNIAGSAASLIQIVH